MEIDLEKLKIDSEKLEKLKVDARQKYDAIGNVHCPYLKCEVAFNSKGIEHLIFKEKGKSRSPKEQYLRFKLLPLAEHIIKNSNTLQEYQEKGRFERQKINSRWENRLTTVIYYGFVAIVNGARIKIIVKEIKGGNKYFYSIIPFWKSNKKELGNKKILHAGDMEND
jgi:hypothetical protein